MPLKYYAMPWLVLQPALKLTFNGFEQLIVRGGNPALFLIMVSLIVFWHIYTPIHELLHVGACLMGGGTVSALALKPQYGGTILAQIFPFVVAESDYAGQLTGFTTPNDLVYAWVDVAPYVLSLPGLALLTVAVERRRAWLFGPALVLALVPLMSFSGDFFELASLATTRMVPIVDPSLPARLLVSDDSFKLAGSLAEQKLLFHPIGLLALLTQVLGILAACWVLVLQLHLVYRLWGGCPDLKLPPTEEASGSQPE
ncbi:hypothetical protein APED_20970 [Acanthopleuribacter pedis]